MKRATRVLQRSPLRPGTLARSMALTGGSAAFSQAIVLLSAPILARLYEPEAFGLLGTYVAFVLIAVTVSSLRYDFAVPLAESDGEAVNLVAVSLALTLATSVALAVATFLSGPTLASALGVDPLIPLLWLLPVAVLGAGAAQALSAWGVYRGMFPTLARVRTVQAVALVSSQIGLALMQFGAAGLVVGDVIGRLVGTEGLVRSMLRALRSTPVTIRTVVAHGRARWSFARVMVVASLLNSLTLQMPFLLIPAAFGLAASGQFFLAYRLLILPASLVSAAVYQVFLREATSRRGEPGRLRELVHGATVHLLAFAVPTYAVIIAAAPVGMATVFGPDWAAASVYAQLLAPSLVLKAVTGPISSLLLVGRREGESLMFTAVELAAKTAALAIGVVAGSLTAGVAAFSVVTVVLGGASLWRFLRVASVTLRDILAPASQVAGRCAPSVVFVAVVAAVVPQATIPAAMAAWFAAVFLTVRFSNRASASLQPVA